MHIAFLAKTFGKLNVSFKIKIFFIRNAVPNPHNQMQLKIDIPSIVNTITFIFV